jgi:hypothetical protein
MAIGVVTAQTITPKISCRTHIFFVVGVLDFGDDFIGQE